MKSKNLLLGLFLSFVVCSSAFAKTPSMSQYWEETGLTFKDVEAKVNDSNCYAKQENFLGCISAYKTLLFFSKSPLAFVSQKSLSEEKDLEQYLNVKTVYKDFGLAKIVEGKKQAQGEEEQEKDFSGEYEKGKARNKRMIQVWMDLFKNPSQGKVPFTKMVQWYKEKVLPTDKQAETVAAVIDAYLKVIYDPHAGILPKRYMEDQMKSTTELFYGIGAVLHMVKGKVVIQSPMPTSPALAAGLKARDVITYVKDVDVKGKKLDEVVDMIRGPLGTQVKLTIQRGEQQPFTVVITRAEVKVEEVSPAKLLDEDRGTKIGYIKLAQFMEQSTYSTFKDRVKYLESQNVEGLVLDLREDGGGLLNMAVDMANIFLDRSKVVVEVRPLDGIDPLSRFMLGGKLRTSFPKTTGLPLITLVDAGSASASEILAGALQDHQRSYLVGVRTFGKGSVQTMHDADQMPEVGLPYPHLQFKKTVARFYLPSGRTNQVVGVTPDFTVYTKPNPSKNDMFAMREEDIFENALPPVGPAWVQPRPEKVAQIQTCMDKTKTAEKRFESQKDAAIEPDYQILYAQDVMYCVLQTQPKGFQRAMP